MNQILIQGIGYIALFFAVISFQKNKRGKILFLLITAEILFILHFSLLHAWVGAAMNALSALRSIIFSQKERRAWAQSPVWMWIFVGASLLAGLMTWTNYASLLPMIAM